jgi:hypothetical protein
MTQEDSSFSEEKGSKKTFISLGLWRAAAPDSTPNVQKSFASFLQKRRPSLSLCL